MSYSYPVLRDVLIAVSNTLDVFVAVSKEYIPFVVVFALLGPYLLFEY